MKNRFFPHSIIVLLLSAALAQCQQLTIQTEGGKQTVSVRSDIESLPHVKVVTHGTENNATFEGVALLPSLAQAQGPVFTITPEESDVKFFVKASVAIDGKFNNWEATLTFPSTDVTSGVLDIKISADSVDTGSGMKDNKLKSKDFFNASEDPYITFHSTKVVQTGPTTFDVPGTFTLRGVSKPETLHLTLSGKGTGEGSVRGTMTFDRKDFGMNKGIPFVKIGDRVEVSVALRAHKVSGPPLVYQQ
jgi:polyisoprenoid-binding protein YceI